MCQKKPIINDLDKCVPGLTTVHPGGSGGGSTGGITSVFFLDEMGFLNDAVSNGCNSISPSDDSSSDSSTVK